MNYYRYCIPLTYKDSEPRLLTLYSIKLFNSKYLKGVVENVLKNNIDKYVSVHKHSCASIIDTISLSIDICEVNKELFYKNPVKEVNVDIEHFKL